MRQWEAGVGCIEPAIEVSANLNDNGVGVCSQTWFTCVLCEVSISHSEL